MGGGGCRIGFPISTLLPQFTSDFISQLFSFLFNFPHIFLANLLIFYFVSVIIVEFLTHYRLSGKAKSQWKEFLRPSNFKITFTIIASFFGIIFYLSLSVPTTGEFLHNIFSNLSMIVLPLSLYSYLLFYAGAGISYLFQLILLVFGNPFLGSYGPHPANITSIGWIYFTIILLVGWYLTSSAIEQLYFQFIKKKKSKSE